MHNVTTSISKHEQAQRIRLKDYLAKAGYDANGHIIVWSADKRLVREYRIIIEGKLVTRETWMNNWEGQPGYDSNKLSPYFWHPCREALLSELKFEEGKLVWPPDSTLWKPDVSDRDFRKMQFPTKLPIEAKRLIKKRKYPYNND